MKLMNVEGLPEPVAEALKALAEALRGRFQRQGPDAGEIVDPEKLRTAILARRDASLAEGRDWEIGASSGS
jgi:hypothetical protein